MAEQDRDGRGRAPGPVAGRRRSSFGPTVLLGLGAAALATVAAGQGWATATTRSPALRTAVAKGTDVAPLALPLALVALAAWGTVLVLRRRGRRVASLLGFAAAAVALAASAVSLDGAGEVAAGLLGDGPDVSTSTSAWPWVTIIGCAASGLASAVALRKAPGWPEMSSRYDAPGGPDRGGATTDADLWKALDEGHDPTA